MTQHADVAPRAAWTATAFFTAAYTLHSADRFVISAVVEPLKHEFALTDTQLGAVAGLAHAIGLAILVLPVGWLLDRVNRVRLFSAMLGIWSALTLLGGFATSYMHLFAMRLGVGAAELATAPSVQSLTGSLFPAKGRASAMGVIFSGVAIGTGLIFAVGGTIADRLGWRYVFLLAGLPGILLAILMWNVVKEPARKRGNTGGPQAPSMRETLLFIYKTPTILFTFLGFTITSMAVGSVWTWTTPTLIRQHGFSLTEAGFVVGVASGIIKFISTFLSGFLGDWIANGRINRLWIVPACALTLSIAAAAGVAFGPRWLIAAFVMLLGFTLGTHYAAPRAVVISATPERMRGSVASVQELTQNLLGAGMGPVLTGMISDLIGGKESAGLALLATLSFNIIAALCFWQAARRARDVEEIAP